MKTITIILACWPFSSNELDEIHLHFCSLVLYNQIEMKAKHGAKMKHIKKQVDVIVNLHEYGNIFTGSSEFDLGLGTKLDLATNFVKDKCTTSLSR